MLFLGCDMIRLVAGMTVYLHHQALDMHGCAGALKLACSTPPQRPTPEVLEQSTIAIPDYLFQGGIFGAPLIAAEGMQDGSRAGVLAHGRRT